VIDKDYAASMLAASLSADLFIILTGVERVSKNDAAIRFIEAGGKEVLIAKAETLSEALEGRTGTLVRERA
jgi:carbamate kinase